MGFSFFANGKSFRMKIIHFWPIFVSGSNMGGFDNIFKKKRRNVRISHSLFVKKKFSN